MSAYTELDLQRSAKDRAAKIKSSVAALAEDARDHLSSAREKGLDLAHASSDQAVKIARRASVEVRKRPVSTGLIAAGIGVGLVFLLSSRARGAAVQAGESLWASLTKRR